MRIQGGCLTSVAWWSSTMSSAPDLERLALTLSPGEHAWLELRSVGLRLCAMLEGPVRARSVLPLQQTLEDCRAQLALLARVPARPEDIREEVQQAECELAVRVSA